VAELKARASVGKLEGKVAIVTGGTSGIGAATARLFAAEGASVLISGRRIEHGAREVAAIHAAGGRAAFEPADHTEAADCERVVAAALGHFGRIDILFNNAGIVTSGTAESVSEDTWSQTLALNVTAVWRMSRLVLPHLRAAGGGAIVNNGSDWAVVGAPHALPYAVSKGAVAQLTRSMALDHAHENIRVNAVCPGDTWVERWAEQGYFPDSGPVSREQAMQAAQSAIPMRRVAEPIEIARAVLYLASADSSYVTGHLLLVDGGNTAR
jgi:NAD(P)-dependent dehydrogenase (short-subunit alcohol dehydrogenase family)